MAHNPSDDTFFGVLGNALRDALDHRTTSPSKRSKPLPKDPAKRFESSHWGVKANKKWTDPDFKGELTEMGKLRELHVEWEDEDGEPQAEVLEFPKRKSGRPPILAFTTDTAERLYLSLPGDVKQQNKQLIDPEGEWITLNQAAKMAGGRQARWGYPNVRVQPLGHCTDIVYATNKKTDGPSEYIHKFAEEGLAGSCTPILCVDRDGRLWLAGGSYSVPDEGITD